MRAAFDKYKAYSESVQSSFEDARFLRRIYREINQAEPVTMREDFCGAFALCCEWVKLSDKTRAIGLDIDPEPIAYGRKNHLPQLDSARGKRVSIFRRDVLKPGASKADLICALNFSYFIFHRRETLLQYFIAARKTLSKNGLLVVDNFGGPNCCFTNTESRRMPGFTYKFEQKYFDPINNHAKFSIHFKPKGRRLVKDAFTYDWRMWSIPELKDLMLEAGFRDVAVYWEGTARDGSGSGVFHKRSRGEECQVWIAYIVGIR